MRGRLATPSAHRRRRRTASAMNSDLKTDFPIHEQVEDFSGRQRSFVIDCHEGALGYTVRASEEAADGFGYEFRSEDRLPHPRTGRGLLWTTAIICDRLP